MEKSEYLTTQSTRREQTSLAEADHYSILLEASPKASGS